MRGTGRDLGRLLRVLLRVLLWVLLVLVLVLLVLVRRVLGLGLIGWKRWTGGVRALLVRALWLCETRWSCRLLSLSGR